MKHRTGWLTSLLVASLLVTVAPHKSVCECSETFLLNDSAQVVPDWWCGRKIDSLSIAEPEHLVQLPQQLTYEDYRIYVRPDTRDAFTAMAAAARTDSVELIADSGFRSRPFQGRLIVRRMEQGEKLVEVLLAVAPPGYSEHHTGRALDLVPSGAEFAKTTAYFWLKENAADFGFIESLPEDSTNPGLWECWHWYFQD